MDNFYIKSYSKEQLVEIFSKESKSPDYCVAQKKHVTYFDNYLSALNTKSVLVELFYVDKDYLEDYSSYYVKSFNEYKRFCTRIHFFAKDFTNDDFILLLKNGKLDNLSITNIQESYNGFIVLKPLPQTIIGKTCLRTYSTIDSSHSITREYEVNLFGIKLFVNSIAYQEQDSIVAACASSAIWSAFQWTGLIFQHRIQSPVQITTEATKYFPFANRHIPNKGLTSEQMAHAIRNVGLVPQIYNGEWNSELDLNKAIIYSYLRAKIPIVLGVNLINQADDDTTIEVGRHAITVLGFKIKNDYDHSPGFRLLSSAIEKIYAHDDQIGPFARMEFMDDTGLLSTSWLDDSGVEGNIFAHCELLILPLYNKIRIPFKIVLQLIKGFDQIIKHIDSVIHFGISDIIWDIFLSTTQGLKSEIFNSSELNSDHKFELLNMSLPKYVWRAIGYKDDGKIEFLFDATDLEQGELLIIMIPYSQPFAYLLDQIIKLYPVNSIKSIQLRKMFISLSKN